MVYLGLAAGFFTRLQQRCQPALRSHLKARPRKDLLPGPVHQRTQFLVGCWVKSFAVTCQPGAYSVPCHWNFFIG